MYPKNFGNMTHPSEDSLANWTSDHLANCERIEIIGEAMEHASGEISDF